LRSRDWPTICTRDACAQCPARGRRSFQRTGNQKDAMLTGKGKAQYADFHLDSPITQEAKLCISRGGEAWRAEDAAVPPYNTCPSSSSMQDHFSDTKCHEYCINHHNPTTRKGQIGYIALTVKRQCSKQRNEQSRDE
jgi:hypothetical protein